PERAQRCVIKGRDVLPIDEDSAFGRTLEQIQHANQCTFTGAGAPNNAKYFPPLNAQAYAVQSMRSTLWAGDGLAQIFTDDQTGPLSPGRPCILAMRATIALKSTLQRRSGRPNAASGAARCGGVSVTSPYSGLFGGRLALPTDDVGRASYRKNGPSFLRA